MANIKYLIQEAEEIVEEMSTTHFTTEEARTMVFNTIYGTVADLLYYDRKEDEELRIGAIEYLIEKDIITVDEIVGAFREELVKGVNQYKRGGY